MTTKLQNLKFQQDIQDAIKHLGLWYHERSLLTLGICFMVTIFFVGGLFFWASQFSYALGRDREQNEMAVARSGLQTIKRMVGDEQVWSKSIQEEYNRIFVGNTTKMQPISYEDNFINTEYPTNQATKQ